ncbi:hypothetical protein [Rhodococcus sp. USK10]|uniref:hypothetical protein n=1 Tax=Rhodococcus sp. USK10 TaxID=2789739 RepID=UPI0021506E7C|nr:hypothetical protein [Rhodococcus sp. USK10]
MAGVFPQALPAFVATALHRFDINLRASVILGYVGVSGIGMELSLAMKTMNYPRGMALALFVVALCVVIELVSGAVRRSLLGDRAPKRRGLRERVLAAGDGWAENGDATSDKPAALRTAGGAYRISPPWTGERIRRTLYLGATALALAAATWASGIDLSRMADGITSLPVTLDLFFPPGTGGIWDELLAQLLVTVQIALAATLLGLLLPVPIGILAARNVAPTPGVAKFFRIVLMVFAVVMAVEGIAMWMRRAMS